MITRRDDELDVGGAVGRDDVRARAGTRDEPDIRARAGTRDVRERDHGDHGDHAVPIAKATDLRLYDTSDVPWIAIVVDHVMSCIGQPYRVLREQLEHAPIRTARTTAILAAMRRLMDGRAERTRIARTLRATVLGAPALDAAERDARLVKASEELGIDASEIESLLWIDLAEERPVTLPRGRPDELHLAAYANLDRIQHALRRARHVRIHAWGDAHELVRTAARCGLLVRVSAAAVALDPEGAAAPGWPIPARRTDRLWRPPAGEAPSSSEASEGATRGAVGAARDRTVLDILGPLSLFHRTPVYGRALGALVPYLASLDRFVVEIDATFDARTAATIDARPDATTDARLGEGVALRIVSPVLLPPVPSGERRKPSIASRIAAALERTPGVVLERDPAPIAHGTDRLFPDLALELVPAVLAQPDAPDALDALAGGRRPSTRTATTSARPTAPATAPAAIATAPPRAHTDIDDREAPAGARREEDRELYGDPTELVASQMTEAGARIASANVVGRPRAVAVALPVPERPDRSRCWFVEVVGFATREYLAAKLARYAAAGIDRVVLVVDDTRDPTLRVQRRVLAYERRTIAADVLRIVEDR